MSTKVFTEGFKPRNVFSKHIPTLIENPKTEIAGFSMANIKSQIVNRCGQNVLKNSYVEKLI
jgi:hypothetical protein